MPKIRFKNGIVRNVPKFRAKALIKTGAATVVKKNTYQTRQIVPPSNTAMTAPQPSLIDDTPANDELSVLRAEYQERIGKKPFHGWDEETLRQKMLEANEGDQ